jgi:serralysin
LSDSSSSNILFNEKIMTTTISAPINSTTGFNITVPSVGTSLSTFWSGNGGANINLAVSISTTATKNNLTSLGNFSSGGSAWRLTNGTNSGLNGTLASYRTNPSFSGQYFLPAQTNTFVASTASGTHILTIGSQRISKARLNQPVSDDIVKPEDFVSTNFVLRGAGGNDTLTGGTGNDTLIGFAGADSLTGGTGADKFVFNNPNEGIDTITDFTLSDNDVINVSATGFGGGLTAGALAEAEFLSGAGANTATDSLQRFIYDTTSGALFFDQDGDLGGFSAIQIATLSNSAGIGNTNIVVI